MLTLNEAAEHRIITQGPMNVRDWRITCLCMERFIGNGAKDARRIWEQHVAEATHVDAE